MNTPIVQDSSKSVSEREEIPGIYLDQSAYGNMMESSGGEWKKSELGQALIRLQGEKIAQVWIGPTNIMETMVTSNMEKRKSIALMQLELIDNKRIWSGSEYEIIIGFILSVKELIPNSIRTEKYFDYNLETMRQIWLGGLAMVAANGAEHSGIAIDEIKLIKLQNRLIHSRIACDPDKYLKIIIEYVKSEKVIDETFDDIFSMSLESLERETEDRMGQLRRASADVIRKLQINRQNICNYYGGHDIPRYLFTMLNLPLHFELTFDTFAIVNGWRSIKEMTGVSLPKEIALASKEELHSRESTIKVVLHLVKAISKLGLPMAATAYEIILRELEVCINKKEVPTGGLLFDGDHATSVWRFDVFVTKDVKLLNNMKVVAKQCSHYTRGNREPQIFSTAEQILKYFGVK